MTTRAALPGPHAPEPDFGDGLPAVVHDVIARGEQALQGLRKNTVEGWIAAGAAWKTMQGVAMYRSNSNRPAGRRYARAYQLLEQPWPHLTRIDRDTRSNAIWLFESEDLVKPWLATLSQKERDAWTHPRTIRRRYENWHLNLSPKRPRKARKPRSGPLVRKQGGPRSLENLSRDELEHYIADLEDQLSDRDREIAELNDQLDERDRTIEQLRNDLAWERASRRQLEAIAAPSNATVVRPDGATVEVVHAVSRESQEIMPPVSYGHPDYAAWAKLVRDCINDLSSLELRWLLDDNTVHLDALERAVPGAGVGLADRIGVRIAELEEMANVNP